jgi:hypothetical protein
VDVIDFISRCPRCQRNKARRHRSYGLLQPLELPEGPFNPLSYDFIRKLPPTPRGHDFHCVFVDRFLKMAFFVPCNKEIIAQGFAQLYVDHVWATQELSKTFISDRDTRFTSAFWRKVTVLLGTRLCMSSTFHTPTDGQTENANQVFETHLRHFIAPTMTGWDEWLSRAKIRLQKLLSRICPFHAFPSSPWS